MGGKPCWKVSACGGAAKTCTTPGEVDSVMEKSAIIDN